MSYYQNFSKLLHKTKSFRCHIRSKADLAKPENYRNVVDLSYSSYQGTESIFLNGKALEQPIPLVILHGLLGCKANFNTVAKRCHDNTKPKKLVFTLDLRNHGESAHSSYNSYDDLLMDILKFTETMDLKKFDVLGHDVGGRVGMLLALKYPELVNKLIITDISPISTSHQFKVFPEVLKTLHNISFPINLPLKQASLHVASNLSRVVKNKRLMSFVLMNLVQKSDGSYTWRFNIKALLDNFEALSSFPEIHNIDFQGPVLFIGGSNSDYIQKSDYPKILKLFPNADLKYIEGAGHWVHSEKPNEFLKMTLEFLNKTES